VLFRSGKMATGEEIEDDNAGLAAAAEGMSEAIASPEETIATTEAPAEDAPKAE